MRPNSPSAVFVSLILHGFAAAVIFVTTMFVARQDRVAPVIFELVAGPPTAPDELVEKAAVRPDPSMARELKQSEGVSYQEFLKKHPTPKQSTTTPPRPTAKVPRIDVTGIAGGVAGGSTANTRGGGGGNALTREEHSQLGTYISLLIQELKRAHEPHPGGNHLFEAKGACDITAGRRVMDPRISKSSGDKAF